MAINKNFLFELSVFIAIVALAGHLTTHFWDRYFFHHEISNIKTNLHMLKHTVRNIGDAYDDLHKELNELAKQEQRRNSAHLQYNHNNRQDRKDHPDRTNRPNHSDRPYRQHHQYDQDRQNSQNRQYVQYHQNGQDLQYHQDHQNRQDIQIRHDHHNRHNHQNRQDNQDRNDRYDHYGHRNNQKQYEHDQYHDEYKRNRHLDRRKQHEINVLSTLKEKGTLRFDNESKKPSTISAQTQSSKNATTLTKSCLKSTGVGINTKKYCIYKQDCRCNKTKPIKHWK